MSRRRVVSILAWIFLATCIFWYVRETIWLEIPGLIDDNSDFRFYQQAARAVVSGRSPYTANGYIYPPTTAFLMTPLARLDYVTGRRVWFAIEQVFLVAAGVLLWRRRGRDLAAACWIAFVWAVGGSAVEALGLGQMGPVLTLALTVVCTETGWLQGAAAVFCFAVKLFPGIVALGVALRRERAPVMGGILAAVALLVVPWFIMRVWLPGPMKPYMRTAWAGTPATLSWSLPSVVLRILDPPVRGPKLPENWLEGVDLEHIHPPAAHQRYSAAVGFAVLLAGLVILIRTVWPTVSAAQSPFVTGALTSLVLAASPVGWTHYQVTQYPTIALLLLATWRSRRWLRLAGALSLASLLYPVPVWVLTRYHDAHGGWTADSPATLLIWTSVTPLAMLALFGVFLIMAREAGSLVAREDSVRDRTNGSGA